MWIVPAIFSSKRMLRAGWVIPSLQPIPSSPTNRAPSSIESAASSVSSPRSARASSARPLLKRRRMRSTAPPSKSVGRSKRIVPSAESSTGAKKNSPPGMFTFPSSTSPSRSAIESVRSVSSPTMRTMSAASNRASSRFIRSSSASQSRSTAP